MAEKLQQVINLEPDNTIPSIYGDIDKPQSYMQPLHLTRRSLFNGIQMGSRKLLLINFNYHHEKQVFIDIYGIQYVNQSQT